MGQNVMRRPPKFVHGFIDRHGKPRWYFRRAGFKKIPLPGLPWSPEFMAAYEEALAGQPLQIGSARTKPGTVRTLAVSYFNSSDFRSLRPSSQAIYRGLNLQRPGGITGQGIPRDHHDHPDNDRADRRNHEQLEARPVHRRHRSRSLTTRATKIKPNSNGCNRTIGLLPPEHIPTGAPNQPSAACPTPQTAHCALFRL
jgi:hypothetical protein